MRNTRQDELRLAEQAAEWAGTLDEAGPRERAEFAVWARQSPKHVEEFLLASAIYRELDGIDPQHRQSIELLLSAEPNVVPLQAEVEASGPQVGGAPTKLQASLQSQRSSQSQAFSQRQAPKQSQRARQIGIAASVCAVALLFVFLLSDFGWTTYDTQIGEQSTFTLRDGSVVRLNTHSQLQVRFTDEAREIRLRAGEALFTVAHDARHPFRVATQGAVIQAIGTQFNVYRRDSDTRVAVIEGAVRIVGPGEPRDDSQSLVVAGQATRIEPNGQFAKPAAADTASAVSWQQRRLVFRDEKLADVATEFNRYNRSLQIRVEGAAAERKLSGVFDADAPESLLRFLSGAEELQVERAGAAVTIR